MVEWASNLGIKIASLKKSWGNIFFWLVYTIRTILINYVTYIFCCSMILSRYRDELMKMMNALISKSNAQAETAMQSARTLGEFYKYWNVYLFAPFVRYL